jgi:hypothetical protein
MAEAIKTRRSDAAELVGSIIQALMAVNSMAMNRHLVHLSAHERDKARRAGDTATAAFFQKEMEDGKASEQKATADFKGAVRQLKAIKLSLEGETPETIATLFADEDLAVSEFQQRIEESVLNVNESVSSFSN